MPDGSLHQRITTAAVPPSIDTTGVERLDGDASGKDAGKQQAAAKAGKIESSSTFDKAQRSFMYTSWLSKPKEQWSLAHKLFAMMQVIPNMPDDKPAPVYKVGDPIPVWRKRDQALDLVPWCLAPLALHYGYMKYTGNTVHPLAAYALYTAAYQMYSVWTSQRTAYFGQKYGFLDGEKARDHIPDALAWHILLELAKVVTLRPLLCVMLAYNREELPSVSIFLPIKLLVWSLVLDFWFYWYHRLMHQTTFLWKFHRTHHMTKHPTSPLSAFADIEQEVFDAVVIPLITYACVHPWFNFSEWFIATVCVMQAESSGHSGARVRITSVMNAWALEPFGLELLIEDHDLHHRQGYRHLSGNYGKQCLLWDHLFGTARPRQEMKAEYIDWDTHVSAPYFIMPRWVF